MGVIKEPKNIDFIINSKPWTEEELVEFRAIIKKRNEARAKKISRSINPSHVSTGHNMVFPKAGLDNIHELTEAISTLVITQQ